MSVNNNLHESFVVSISPRNEEEIPIARAQRGNQSSYGTCSGKLRGIFSSYMSLWGVWCTASGRLPTACVTRIYSYLSNIVAFGITAEVPTLNIEEQGSRQRMIDESVSEVWEQFFTEYGHFVRNEIEQVFEKKKVYDPELRFMNKFYQQYAIEK